MTERVTPALTRTPTKVLLCPSTTTPAARRPARFAPYHWGTESRRGRSMERRTQRRSGTTRGRHRTRGQALVEFAMVLPVFMVLLVGMLDAGFGLYNKMTIISAAREGARAAVSIDTTNSASLQSIPSVVQAAAINAAAQGGITTANSNIAVTVACVAGTGHSSPCNFGSGPGTAAQQGDAVKVTVTYTYPTLFKFLFGAGIDMDSITQMVLDN